MRTITAVTVARSDYGILLPVLRRIQDAGDLRLRLLVSGMHLSPEFGMSIKQIEADGFAIDDKIEMLLSSDSPEGVSASMGLGMIGFARSYARQRPDLLLAIGDRTEMHAAVSAALPFKIPVAHIHGGEISIGAIDDFIRHSITKLSHLHFVSTQEYGRRILQMGEEPWRITVSGAPGLDNLRTVKLLTAEELEKRFPMKVNRPPILVTYHPVTLEYEDTEWQVGELLAALEATGRPIVITKPNADTHGRIALRMYQAFAERCDDCYLVDNLGTQAYFSTMKLAAIMVGNSSSGLIEAPSFHLPVVNVGNRQQLRARGPNVIDVGYTRAEILEGIRQGLDPAFRRSLQGIVNPFGDGQAAERIVERLRAVELDDRLLRKRFHNLDPATLRLVA